MAMCHHVSSWTSQRRVPSTEITGQVCGAEVRGTGVICVRGVIWPARQPGGEQASARDALRTYFGAAGLIDETCGIWFVPKPFAGGRTALQQRCNGLPLPVLRGGDGLVGQVAGVGVDALGNTVVFADGGFGSQSGELQQVREGGVGEREG